MRAMLTALLASLILIPAAAAAAEIVNSETPDAGEVRYVLREVWRRGDGDDDMMFGVVPELVPGEDGEIYVLDNQLSEIQVLDAGGGLLRTIGREGEGPGEFRNGGELFWMPGGELGVIQNWPGKIVLLRPDGTPGRPFKMPYRDGTGFQAASRGERAGDHVVISGSAWVREGEQQFMEGYLKAYDRDGNEMAHYTDYRRPQDFGGWTFEEERWTDFQRRWSAAPDGRVAAALDYRDYRIHVWNADGSLDRVIVRPEHELVKRDGEERKLLQAMYDRFTRWNPNSTFNVSDVYQAVAQMHFDAEGMLWVQSGADRWRSGEGVATSFDLYDQDGRYVRRVVLEGDVDAAVDGIFPIGDRVYVVTDLLSAVMASAGVEDEDELLGEVEPVTVVAYELVEAESTP